ncbi:MAG: hypothetical protein H6825_08255 [Planctomycetes bacterium]|nr:hypothetical protein [Planctomycetota bacterium]
MPLRARCNPRFALGLVVLAIAACATTLDDRLASATPESLLERPLLSRLEDLSPGSLDALFAKLDTCEPDTELESSVGEAIRVLVEREYRRHVPEARCSKTYRHSPVLGMAVDPGPLRAWWTGNRERVLAREPFDLPDGMVDTHGMSFLESVTAMGASSDAAQVQEPDPETLRACLSELGYVGRTEGDR